MANSQIKMNKQTRRVKLSAHILAEMLTQGRVMHFRVARGLPQEVEILSFERDITSASSNPALIMTVRGFFAEGNDGDLFDILIKTITDEKVANPT
jgi:hypothetical protein